MLGYSELRKIQKQEMESSQIVPLELDFYTNIAEFLASKKEEAIKSNSILSIKEYENIRRIVAAIQTKREEKIVLMAVRSESRYDGLTKEEQIMLKDLASIIEKSHSEVALVWGLEKHNTPAKKILRVKMLHNVEQYRGQDDLLYGPFRTGEEQILPVGEANWLLKSGMAVEA